jgi:putative membrane protein
MGIADAIPLGDTWGMHGVGGAGWMIGMMAIMVLFWGGIILGVVWLVRGTIDGRPGRPNGRPSDTRAGRETPTQVLDRRFAEGAISLEDYQARRKVLADGAAEASGAHEDEALVAPRA